MTRAPVALLGLLTLALLGATPTVGSAQQGELAAAFRGELRAQLSADTTWYRATVADASGCFGVTLAHDPELAEFDRAGLASKLIRAPDRLARLERRSHPDAPWEPVPLAARRAAGACLAARAEP